MDDETVALPLSDPATKSSHRVAALACVLVTVLGCGSPRSRVPDIARIYADAATVEPRNPVIVIHGVLGSRLVERDGGQVVWGAFTNEAIDPESREGIRALAVPLDPPSSPFVYDENAAAVYASGPLERLEVDFLFTTISVDVYADIIRSLGIGGYRDRVVPSPIGPLYAEDHYTCFSFFYDWRRDCVENAIRLGEYIEAKREEIATTAPRQIARLEAEGSPRSLAEAAKIRGWLRNGYRFDIVAHSMGGLIARYYLRHGKTDMPPAGSPAEPTWAGAKDIDRLICIAPPNFGSVFALDRLVNGFDLAFFLPNYHPAVIGTMPALYQLLPRNRHRVIRDAEGKPVDIDLFDAGVWERNRWGLFDAGGDKIRDWLLEGVPGAERATRLRTHLAWCLDRAQRFHEALDVVPKTPCPTRLSLFGADAEPTPVSVHLKEVEGRWVPVIASELDSGPGDGTVPRYSALGDERQGATTFEPYVRGPIPWANVTFLPDDHLGLTDNPTFVDNLLYLLLEQPPRPFAVP